MANFVPHVGVEFRTSDKAWAFWLSYGGQKGGVVVDFFKYISLYVDVFDPLTILFYNIRIHHFL